jgi:PHP family Zn ribbon phosphoesterase
METYSSLLEYAYKDDRLGEEFFFGRLRSLKESISEREFQMREREEVSEHILSQIEEEAQERAHRLKMLPMSYASERALLSKAIESLQHEKRQELVRRTRDISMFSKELREKLEEYEGMKQLFSALTVTKKSQSDRDGGLDVRA